MTSFVIRTKSDQSPTAIFNLWTRNFCDVKPCVGPLLNTLRPSTNKIAWIPNGYYLVNYHIQWKTLTTPMAGSLNSLSSSFKETTKGVFLLDSLIKFEFWIKLHINKTFMFAKQWWHIKAINSLTHLDSREMIWKINEVTWT